ncbi:hypothetical protein A2U01_0109815 [Trifolium medium]|uniref:Uncharacterized protein n=1 Tax=Trifolium medium TaxID=97028 RepID=A0A392VJE8_9FABA|nr:hypothetical protein [Trifolium medium]
MVEESLLPLRAPEPSLPYPPLLLRVLLTLGIAELF